jgi:hypothetical protein
MIYITKFHDDRFRPIKVINSKIRGAAVLLFLDGGIYEARLWDGLGWQDGKIYIPSFMSIGSDIQKLLGRGYTYRHTAG